MACYIGVDPGAKGSLCLLDTTLKLIEFTNPPGDLVSSYEVFYWLKRVSLDGNVRMTAIEDVHSIHQVSAKSNFSFGRNVGLLQAILEISQIGMEKVQPKAWQKACGISFKKGMAPAARKKHVAAIALQLYPKAELFGPKGGLLDGRADALMIAHYLSIKYGTQTNGSKTGST